MKSLSIILTLTLLCTVLQAQPGQESLLSSYLGIKDALVKGNQQESSRWAQTFIDSFKSAEEQADDASLLDALKKHKTALLKNATLIQSEKDIEKQRKAFAELSTEYWALIKVSENTKTLFYDYCPMKKSYWISTEAVIQNPYYGSKMLSCGKVAEKIN